MNAMELLKMCAENNDIDVRRYSGRFMFGSECASISGDPEECNKIISDCIDELFDAIANEEIETPEARGIKSTLMNYKQDSMGLGVVYYWPRMKWVEEEVEA